MATSQTDPTRVLSKARQAVYRLLKIRLRSEYEIRSRLRLKSYSDTVINTVVEYFTDIGLIDDREFSRRWIVSRQSKPYGRNRIRFELKKKGINDTILNEELEKGFKDFSEEQVVCQLIQRRAEKYTNVEPRKCRQRIYDYLQRRGFSKNTIIKVLENYDS